ncbi:MAG: sigma-70 family RNA polymerase sigma factor [Pirellulaceae bacterium]
MTANSKSNDESRAPAQVEARYETFLQLIVQHEPMARSYLRGLLPAWNDIDEVVQEASLVAWRKFDSFERGTSFGGWYLTIARFEALRFRRNLARSPLVFSADVWELLESESRAHDDSASRLEHLESCLNKLGEPQRSLVLKAHTPGVVIRDLAEQAGRSEQAFYKALQRWRHSLRACITKALALEGKE